MTASLMFLGILTGIVIVWSAAIALFPLGSALWEWVLEAVVDRGRAPAIRPEGDPVEVLVSDLHIDTWDYEGAQGRHESFCRFLSAVRASPGVTGFILNGDLMDIPLFAGSLTERQDRNMLEIPAGSPRPQGVLDPRYDGVLGALFNLERHGDAPSDSKALLRAVFQTGNHDVGVNGLRFVRRSMPAYMPSVRSAWSPELLLKGSPEPGAGYDNWTYIEHGQAYDPFLWLYTRYALLDILRGGRLGRESGYIEAMQRGGRTGMDRTARGTERRKARGETEAVTEKPASPAPDTDADWHFADAKHSFGEWITRNAYRLAARRAFSRLPRYCRDEQGRRWGHGINVQTVTFGHTHIPDRYVFPDGRVYINSGDWCGNTAHQCYSVVYANGVVRGPFQWESAEKAVFARDSKGETLTATA